MIFTNNKKLNALNKVKKFIWKEISVENIIKNNFKLDQIANSVLNQNQLNEYYSSSKEVFDIDNDIDLKRLSPSKSVLASSVNTNSNMKMLVGNKNEQTTTNPIGNLNTNLELAKK